MIKSIVAYAFTCALLLAGQAVTAQETAVAFSGLKHDSNLPVEITADQLSVDQASGKATFAGNVVIGQGSMRLTAGHVEVIYSSDDSGNIAVLDASNGVTLTNGGEAVEANSARYDLNSGEVILAGSVLLTQGSNAISGDKMTIDLETGTGLIDGRVKTILQPGRVK